MYIPVKRWGQPSHHLRFCKYRWNTRESILFKKFIWLRKVKKHWQFSKHKKYIWSWHLWCLALEKVAVWHQNHQLSKEIFLRFFDFPTFPWEIQKSEVNNLILDPVAWKCTKLGIVWLHVTEDWIMTWTLNLVRCPLRDYWVRSIGMIRIVAKERTHWLYH